MKENRNVDHSGGIAAAVVLTAVLSVLAVLLLIGIARGSGGADTGSGAAYETRKPSGETSRGIPDIQTDTDTESAEPETEPDAGTGETDTQTAEPEDDGGSSADAQTAQMTGSMTLREKLCQMIILSPEGLEQNGTVIYADARTRDALEKYPVCGVVYSVRNMKSREQITGLLADTQSFSRIPLILTCDEEGGRVTRLMHTVGTTEIGPMFSYRNDGPGAAYENAATLAADISSFGFNMDLAPVADVLTNPDNTVIGDRAYSDSAEQAAELVAAAVRGFNDGGVACIIKHFPGHGSTEGDSHYGAAYVDKTLEELRRCDFLPFVSGIEAGADAVMIGHLTVKDIDSVPALFSERIVTDILRKELGFDGVVMTDALNMRAITDSYSPGETAVRAVKAGVDILLCPTDIDAALSALADAVDSGEISMERIDESVGRILTLKKNRGIIS